MKEKLEGFKGCISHIVLLLLLALFCGLVNLMCHPDNPTGVLLFIACAGGISVVITGVISPALDWYLERLEKKEG